MKDAENDEEDDDDVAFGTLQAISLRARAACTGE